LLDTEISRLVFIVDEAVGSFFWLFISFFFFFYSDTIIKRAFHRGRSAGAFSLCSRLRHYISTSRIRTRTKWVSRLSSIHWISGYFVISRSLSLRRAFCNCVAIRSIRSSQPPDQSTSSSSSLSRCRNKIKKVNLCGRRARLGLGAPVIVY
jgi:hypothetical protein